MPWGVGLGSEPEFMATLGPQMTIARKLWSMALPLPLWFGRPGCHGECGFSTLFQAYCCVVVGVISAAIAGRERVVESREGDSRAPLRLRLLILAMC